jgi:hypothetical protein
VPFPVDWANADHVAEATQALARLCRLFPEANVLHIGFDEDRTTSKDWIAILNVCRQAGYKAVVGFVKAEQEGRRYELSRPTFQDGRWGPRALTQFVSTKACITHPALYAVFTVDEPWHHQKRPIYNSDELKRMYTELKQVAPAGAEFKILVQFSRELWKQLGRGKRHPQLYWDRGICDIVQISALEFQDGRYLQEFLDQNHASSRRIIHEKTPAIPLWTSVQVIGSGYGPKKGYWFPRERDGHHDLRTLLEAVTDSRYESIHPLAGIMFQAWDSETVRNRPFQYRLGDQDEAGKPVSQRQAGEEALRAIRQWIAEESAAAR